MKLKTEIMDEKAIDKALIRRAHEIIEKVFLYVGIADISGYHNYIKNETADKNTSRKKSRIAYSIFL